MDTPHAPHRTCRLCKTVFTGRSDKLFCSPTCKSVYHSRLSKATRLATEHIDTILHRNRSILLEIMGKSATQKKISRDILDRKNFHFDFITHYHINQHNKTVHYVYDFSWMIFSDQEILIRRVPALTHG